MENAAYGLFLMGAIFFAYRAIVAKRILSATIYLACISALVSAVLYMLGAAQVAVMELSVGAGLVTVLLVYAVSVVGDDAFDPPSVVPKPLAFGMVGLIVVLLGWMSYPAIPAYFEHFGDSDIFTANERKSQRYLRCKFRVFWLKPIQA